MNTKEQQVANRMGCTGCNDGKVHARLYNISVQKYDRQRSVVVEELCNGFTVFNAGTSTVSVNGQPLLPNYSYSVGGNEGEVYIGRLDITFSSTNPANNAAWVTQKFYTGKTI